ncbi:hypothetical protein CXB51_009811 [Gossypium anomalum]|uniref:Uncharacterized protein n=1 Tax=Gossypium anomalum TaxID=47600 RepID=A0A8J5ZMT4_9ROSI|nr:hypothetical protein CXB51_009811 [Gossypium anomalum]
MASRTIAKDITTPPGSAAIVSEAFAMQRIGKDESIKTSGFLVFLISYFCLTFCTIDPEESFAKVKKYGLPQDEGVKSFISNPTAQLSGHSSHSRNVLEKERVVLVMMSKATNEVLERRGGILALKQMVRLLRKVKLKCRRFCSVSREQSDKEIMRETQAIMTQIASTITYLPCLDVPCKSCI